MSVERALVTGKDDEELNIFHFAVFAYANAIERRGNTIFYTVMGEDWPAFMRAVESVNITAQQMDSSNRDEEIWNVVHQGAAAPWKPKSKRK